MHNSEHSEDARLGGGGGLRAGLAHSPTRPLHTRTQAVFHKAGLGCRVPTAQPVDSATSVVWPITWGRGWDWQGHRKAPAGRHMGSATSCPWGVAPGAHTQRRGGRAGGPKGSGPPAAPVLLPSPSGDHRQRGHRSRSVSAVRCDRQNVLRAGSPSRPRAMAPAVQRVRTGRGREGRRPMCCAQKGVGPLLRANLSCPDTRGVRTWCVETHVEEAVEGGGPTH